MEGRLNYSQEMVAKKRQNLKQTILSISSCHLVKKYIEKIDSSVCVSFHPVDLAYLYNLKTPCGL